MSAGCDAHCPLMYNIQPQHSIQPIQEHSRCTGLPTSNLFSDELDGPEFHLDARVGMEDLQLGIATWGSQGQPSELLNLPSSV